MTEESDKSTPATPSLKLKTARTIKWNAIDRVSSQILYAVTGIVLANLLPKEDFGLIGALLVFQAFAILFVDCGFGASLLQCKEPTEKDYSTVFWFNFVVSIAIYTLLWFSAPIIADIFQDDARLIPLSRVMFICFIINGLSIVQTNRLMKSMNVRMIAVSDIIGLIISGIVGIWLALSGHGAWALVWQSISLSAIKTAILWINGKWIPEFCFSSESLRKIYRVGLGVFTSSFLNTLFQNIYSFVIGAYYNLAALGDYTQADKWSKMGSASLSQIFTASFIPVLSQFQDNPDEYKRVIRKINHFSTFALLPAMFGLVVMAEPVFHLLFGNKWDSAIILFQLLSVRGVFVVLSSLCNNYLLALGYAKSIVKVELAKDLITITAILATIFSHSIELLVMGQLCAGIATYIYTLCLTSKKTGYTKLQFLKDMIPYTLTVIVIMPLMWSCSLIIDNNALLILVEATIGSGLYFLILKLGGSATLKEVSNYVFGRFHRKKLIKSVDK